MRDRITVWIGVVGVLALVAGAVLTVVVLRRDDDSASAAAPVRTTRFSSARGGFAVQVPHGMKATRQGRTARFTTSDRQVAVSVGPLGAGTLKATSARLVSRLRASYAQVEVLGRRPDRVRGRPALSTYGTASTRKRVALRFVVLVVAARGRNFGIVTFAAADTDPRRVLPLVNALAGSFRALPATRG